jgi:hypothetical protein
LTAGRVITALPFEQDSFPESYPTGAGVVSRRIAHHRARLCSIIGSQRLRSLYRRRLASCLTVEVRRSDLVVQDRRGLLFPTRQSSRRGSLAAAQAEEALDFDLFVPSLEKSNLALA